MSRIEKLHKELIEQMEENNKYTQSNTEKLEQLEKDSNKQKENFNKLDRKIQDQVEAQFKTFESYADSINLSMNKLISQLDNKKEYENRLINLTNSDNKLLQSLKQEVGKLTIRKEEEDKHITMDNKEDMVKKDKGIPPHMMTSNQDNNNHREYGNKTAKKRCSAA
ncbi:uncharacterized protein PGTG_20544 [Puccinia graminis f. sp. tritici CRL 75-36-700-3]|uniref:Uncharacterized protein n=1 Tax=Puccinia graminis f. sp. tritici (strain CRL 75-36-700-3 / race SCCL) TaxID=418459 RepID=E3NYD9_PUCGT|nr:uncharacterized protein PGTG_20544 [Puccinia graminis f. sp. tritici CRL 75-36-700-3]EFP94588.1 hypothetical protein PGTG_20544 [Puccinia graminis f. sp. tritici CRL 75-36-700-3]